MTRSDEVGERPDEAGASPADEALLRVVAEAVGGLEAVPPEVVEAAQAAFTWRTIDEELAELVDQAALSFDSSTDAEALALRGPATTDRSLTFEYDGVVIDLEVSEVGPEREVAGMVVPSDPVDIELHRPSGRPWQARADQLGRFRLVGVEPGPVRLLCRFSPGSSRPLLLTEWIVI